MAKCSYYLLRTGGLAITIFVHSWFRSGSTWLWKKFRETEGMLALYEPLNEELPLWTPEKLVNSPARAFLYKPFGIGYVSFFNVFGLVAHKLRSLPEY